MSATSNLNDNNIDDIQMKGNISQLSLLTLEAMPE